MDPIFSEIPQDILRTAIRENIASRTLLVTDASGCWGTAVPLKYNRQYMIITAGHTILGVPKENLKFYTRPAGELKNFESVKSFKAYPVKIGRQEADLGFSIKEVKIINDGILDLGIIFLNPTGLENKNINFYENLTLDNKTPDHNNDFSLILGGFARQTALIDIRNKHFALALYVDYPDIVSPIGKSLPNFDPEINFLLSCYAVKENGEPLQELKGVSGAGVYKIMPEKQIGIWRVKVELIGIEISVYGSGLYKCIKIEKIIENIKEL